MNANEREQLINVELSRIVSIVSPSELLPETTVVMPADAGVDGCEQLPIEMTRAVVSPETRVKRV